jgi:hypothetical protein
MHFGPDGPLTSDMSTTINHPKPKKRTRRIVPKSSQRAICRKRKPANGIRHNLHDLPAFMIPGEQSVIVLTFRMPVFLGIKDEVSFFSVSTPHRRIWVGQIHRSHHLFDLVFGAIQTNKKTSAIGVLGSAPAKKPRLSGARLLRKESLGHRVLLPPPDGKQAPSVSRAVQAQPKLQFSPEAAHWFAAGGKVRLHLSSWKVCYRRISRTAQAAGLGVDP